MKDHFVSRCCDAEMEVSRGDEGTSFYICTKCGKSCDFHERSSIGKGGINLAGGAGGDPNGAGGAGSNNWAMRIDTVGVAIPKSLDQLMKMIRKVPPEHVCLLGYVAKDGEIKTLKSEDLKQSQPIDHTIDVRYEKDPIEKFNKFIEKWCGDSFPHLIDDDENDGEFMRETIRGLQENTQEEAILKFKESLLKHGHGGGNFRRLIIQYKP